MQLHPVVALTCQLLYFVDKRTRAALKNALVDIRRFFMAAIFYNQGCKFSSVYNSYTIFC